mgnify:CR=1 FL=1
MIKFLDLQKLNQPFESQFLSKTKEFLDKGWYILGDEVKQFETDFAKCTKTKYCIGVGNGLDAIVLIFKAYIQLGLMKKGDNHPSSKLTEKQVYSIKEELADGGNHRIIAEKYNVAKNTISSINQGLSWKHVILSAVEEKMYFGEIVDIIEKYLLYVEPEVFKRTKRSNIYNWIKENL